MFSPPKRMSLLPSGAMLTVCLAPGFLAVVRAVQLLPSQSHVRVSFVPPYITTLLPSVAMAAWFRDGGTVAGMRWVQDLPSHSQVWSLRKRTTLPFRAAMEAPFMETGRLQRSVQVVPSKVQVSYVRVLPEPPPKWRRAEPTDTSCPGERVGMEVVGVSFSQSAPVHRQVSVPS